MIRTVSLLWLLTVSGALAVVLDPPKAMVTAVLGKDAVLPCAFTSDEATVLQVRWLKRGEDGVDVEVAVLNVEHGTYVEEAYLGRVARASESDTLQDGSIRLRNAVQADEGTYECHLITFPLGNFESSVRLKVLVPPLPTLNLGPPLEEGQGRTLAASCTAEGSPVPNVSWETAVRGETRSQQSSHPRSASVTSEFYVVPGRSMHGQALTCVVSHPGLQHKKKITHTLNVAYLSDASILGHEAEENWVEGREGASLKCLGDGNPPPSYNWSRLDEPLPDGVRIKGDTLTFQRALSSDDEGVYVCQVANSFATKEVQVSVSIRGNRAQQVDVVSVSMIGAGVIAVVLLGLLVLVVALMACYHKRKTKRITEKYEEELTLTRENSIRRLHSSHSTDTRNQTEESLPLRSESRQGSYRGDSLCRESLRGGDSLCRDSRQGSFRADSLRETSLCSVLSEEAEGRSYSTLSTVREIETQTELPPPPPTPVQEERKEEKEEEAGEEEEDEEAEREQRDGEKTIKQAMTHFVQENGTLRAKPTTNGIYINGRGHLV